MFDFIFLGKFPSTFQDHCYVNAFLRSNVSSRALCVSQGRCVLRSDFY